MRPRPLTVLIVTACVGVGCSSESKTPAKKPDAPKKTTNTAPPPPATAGYQGMETVPNAGTIKGVVTYAGSEKDKPLGVKADKCEHAAKPRNEKSLVVADGKLANAVVVLEGIDKGKQAKKEKVVVDNLDCEFEPRVQVALKGATVAAKNSDPILHNTHLYLSQGNKNLFNIALPMKGQVIEKQLRKAGLVDVKCDAHEWMQAWIYVTDHPYATVTDANGMFTLTDVPPGEHKVKVWHERLGEKDATAKVEPNGTAELEIAM